MSYSFERLLLAFLVAVSLFISSTLQHYGTTMTRQTIDADDYTLCGQPPAVENGRYVGGRSQRQTFVRCDPGFTIIGPNYAICRTGTGDWTNPGKCVDISSIIVCNSVPHVANGNVERGSNQVGTQRAVTCFEKFAIKGEPVATCGRDGQWKFRGSCVKDCDGEPHLANGHIEQGDSVSGAMRAVVCDRGWLVNGTGFVRCTADGVWSFPGVCSLDYYDTGAVDNRPKYCDSEPSVPNGYVYSSYEGGGSMEITAERSFVCNQGYVVTGSAKVVCDTSGQWQPQGACRKEITSCMNVPVIPNGYVEPGSSYIGAVRYIRCNDDSRFELVGPSSIECRSTGRWSRIGICRMLISKTTGQTTPLLSTTFYYFNKPSTTVAPSPLPLPTRCCWIPGIKPVKSVALLQAARESNSTRLEQQLRTSADPNSKDDNGWTALMFAAKQGCFDCVDQLLQCCADVNSKSNFGTTALMLAAKADQLEIVDRLLSHGANASERNNEGQTALMLAAQFDNSWVVESLVEAGTSPLEAKDFNNDTALTLAVKGEHGDTVQVLLLAAGADVNTRDIQGRTPLMIAANKGSFNLVSILMSGHQKPNVTAQDSNGNTALALALKGGFADVADLLTRTSEATSVPGPRLLTTPRKPPFTTGRRTAQRFTTTAKWHQTTLSMSSKGLTTSAQKTCCEPHRAKINSLDLLEAATCGNLTAVINELYLKNADPNSKSPDDGWTALMQAAFNNRTEATIELLNCCASVDKRNAVGQTALRLAAEVGSSEVAALLLRHGASPSLADDDGTTPLLIAAENGYADIVDALLENGANIEERDNEGNTALSLAVINDNYVTAEMLLAAGANVKVVDKLGSSPILLATKEGDLNMITLLLLHGAIIGIGKDESDRLMQYADRNKNRFEIAHLLISFQPVFNNHSACKVVPTVFHGRLQSDDERGNSPSGAVKRIRCDHGFKILGPSAISCSEFGWTFPGKCVTTVTGISTSTPAQKMTFSVLTQASHIYFPPTTTKRFIGNVTINQQQDPAHRMPATKNSTTYKTISSSIATEIIFFRKVTGATLFSTIMPQRPTVTEKAVLQFPSTTDALYWYYDDDEGETTPAQLVRVAKEDWRNDDGKDGGETLWNRTTAIKESFLPKCCQSKQQGKTISSTVLLKAAVDRDLVRVLKELDSGNADPNVRNSSNNWTPLMYAAASGNIDIAKALITCCADLNARNSAGKTAVRIATEKASVDMVGFLLTHGAKPDIGDAFDVTPLLIASRNGDLTTVQQLLRYKAVINHKDSRGDSALMLAVLGSRYPTVKVLLNAGADVNVQDTFGVTPLMVAVQQRDVTMAELLLEKGANAGLRDFVAGDSPYLQAQKYGNRELLDVVMRFYHYEPSKASTSIPSAASPALKELTSSTTMLPAQCCRKDVAKTNSWGLVEAARRGFVFSVVNEMTFGNADPNSKDVNNGWTALMYAAYNNYHDVVAALLRCCASTDRVNYGGQTAFDIARVRNSTETIQLLTKAIM